MRTLKPSTPRPQTTATPGRPESPGSRRSRATAHPRLALAPALALGALAFAQEADPGAQDNRQPEFNVPTLEELAARSGDPDRADGRVLDLSLSDALRIALDNGLGLEIASVNSEAQRVGSLGSWGAFDPVFNASGQYVDAEIPQANDFITGGVDVLDVTQTSWQTSISKPFTWGGTFDLGFQSTNTETNNQLTAGEFTDSTLFATYLQPLLRGRGSRSATVEQHVSEIQWRASREALREQRETLLLEVSNAYWDLVAALEQLRVREISVQLGNRQLEQNAERLKVGVGTEVDVLQAETNVASQENQLLLAQTEVDSTMDTLKSVLFRREGGSQESFEEFLGLWELPIVPRTPLPERLDAADGLQWRRSLGRALEFRPELNQRRLEVDIAEARLGAAEIDRLPELNLSLDARGIANNADTSDAYEDSLSLDFPNLTGGLTFSMPLGNATRANAERRARLELISARLTYEQSENTVLAEVRDAVRRLEDGAEIVAVAAKASELARRQLSAEESSYTEGFSTTFQVLEFQQQLAEALSSEKRAQADFAKAEAALKRAEGRLSEQVSLTAPTPEELRVLDPTLAPE